jgi:predicted ATPase
VITGAPCSGKTAVIDELEQRGYRVIHEVARAHIDALLKTGLRLEQIKADERRFERHILHEKIRIESALTNVETIFFDRAVPDSIAYFKLAGLDIEEPLKMSTRVRYKKIFLFERLQWLNDKVRCEDEDRASQLDLLIKESYQRLGYELIPVPIRSVRGRADLVLTHL